MLTSPFLIAFFTTIVRYYDYALFGLSASILAKKFLPDNSHDIQLLNFFAILSGAVIARPIGSLIFGYIGDKYGRVISVKISMFISAFSTILISIMPTFQHIGSIAAMILIFCRMMFLLSLAGEVDAIKVYIAEKTNKNNKNYYLGIVVSCSQIGALFAAIAYYYSNYFDIDYLWRFNFFIGGLLGFVIILLRKFFKESTVFLYYKSKKTNKQIFIPSNIRSSFILATIINGAIGGVYHFLVIFLGVFLAKIAFIISTQEAYIMNITLIIFYGSAAILSGILADKINPVKQISYALILSLIISVLAQFMLYKQVFLLICPGILAALAAFYAIPLQLITQALFPISMKMRAYSLSHSLGSVILSSSTPFISMLLWTYSASLTVTLSFFIVLLVILLCSVLYLIKNHLII